MEHKTIVTPAVTKEVTPEKRQLVLTLNVEEVVAITSILASRRPAQNGAADYIFSRMFNIGADFLDAAKVQYKDTPLYRSENEANVLLLKIRVEKKEAEAAAKEAKVEAEANLASLAKFRVGDFVRVITPYERLEGKVKYWEIGRIESFDEHFAAGTYINVGFNNGEYMGGAYQKRFIPAGSPEPGDRVKLTKPIGRFISGDTFTVSSYDPATMLYRLLPSTATSAWEIRARRNDFTYCVE